MAAGAQLGLEFDEAELAEALAEMDKDNDRWRPPMRPNSPWVGRALGVGWWAGC